ncbi:unnamed protein product, partial [Polarella glacialis]
VLASHYTPGSLGGARSVSFVDALLDAAEGHPQCREVLAHALRALAALLPCPRVREELRRTQTRLLTCLTLALEEALDVAAVRAVCRWLPGVSSEVRQARSRLGKLDLNVLQAVSENTPVDAEDDDVQMADV